MDASNLNLSDYSKEIKQSFIEGKLIFDASPDTDTEPKQTISVKIVFNKVENDSDIAKCKALQGIKINIDTPSLKSLPLLTFHHLGTTVTWDSDLKETAEFLQNLETQIFNQNGANPYFDLDFKGKTPIHSLDWQHRTMKSVQQYFEDKIKRKIQNSHSENLSETFKL